MKNNKNVFKIIATVFVILFGLILVGGVIKMYSHQSSFTKMDPAQIETAKNMAIKQLELQGKNSSDYEVKVLPQLRKMHKDNTTESMVEVSFFGPKETQFYLIDLNSKQVMMHSYTEFYTDDFLEYGPQDKGKGVPPSPREGEDGRWFHDRLVK